jgi:metal-responsive CopG/Arc/MetJ family transcriptional regulator
MRTIVDIPAEVIANLDEIGLRTKRSRASLIRDAVSTYLQDAQAQKAEAAFGVWKSRKMEGLEYQTQARKDWDE